MSEVMDFVRSRNYMVVEKMTGKKWTDLQKWRHTKNIYYSKDFSQYPYLISEQIAQLKRQLSLIRESDFSANGKFKADLIESGE